MAADPWRLNPKEAVERQRALAGSVRLEPLGKDPVIVGGCDVSMDRFASEGFGGFVTLDYPAGTLRHASVVRAPIPFPYVPGLLSFREIPMLLEAWHALPEKPDVLVADGVGIAHPRGLGIASHLGLELGIPTIGCAKSVLYGVLDPLDADPGSIAYLRDPRDHERVIGAALRTKRGVKPVYVSPGHLLTLEDALRIIQALVRRHRIPEPTRLAHEAVNAHRRAHLASSFS